MEDWKKLKQEIKIETNEFFKDKSQIDVNKALDLLQSVCAYPIDTRYKLDGVAIKIPKAMFEILDENTTKKNQILYFEILCKFEPFLRKLLCIINNGKYNMLLSQGKGLSAIIKELNLNPSRIDYNNEILQNQRNYKDYDYHLYRVYNLRNVQSHDMELWSTAALAQNIESIFIFYICVIDKNKADIENLIRDMKKQDYTAYMNKIIAEFEKRAKRFVHIESIEDYSVFEGYAIEHVNLLDEDEEQERAGTIDDIRKQNLPEKRMMIWGEAGMGKSTTLQYLSYLDADEYLNGTSTKVPVYVPLGILIDANEKIEDYIIKKIGTEYIEGIELLKKGEVNLFLDAVNEVPTDISKSLQTQRRKEIQNLLDSYPNTLIIISNRSERYNYFKNIPVFRLQKMNKEKIEEFMNKNVKDEGIKGIILDGIANDFKLLQLIGIPLMATRLIEIVMQLKELPQSEGAIIGRFLDSLYKREMIEKKDTQFAEQKINYLLCDLAEYSLEKYNTNSGMSKEEVLQCFVECIGRLSFSYDSLYALNKLTELGVLECENDIIYFAHQAYQDYYYSRAKKVRNARRFVQTRLESLEVSENLESGCKSENAAFYRQKAHEPQFEKSTIYLVHSYEGKKGEIELHELMKNNLYLAAKAVARGNYSSEIEEQVVQKSVADIRSNKKGIIIWGFLSLLELNRYNEIIENIDVFVANKKNKNMINNIATYLDSENMLLFFEALLKTKDKQVVSVAVSTVYMKDFEYTWNNHNIDRVIKLVEDMRKIYESTSKVMLKFYISFNVPKTHIQYNAMFIRNKLIYQDTALVENFMKKYDISILLPTDEICKKLVVKDKWTAIKNCIQIMSKMPSEEKIKYFQMGIVSRNKYMIYATAATKSTHSDRNY